MKKTACESCSNYIYDEEYGSFYCDVSLDEDEMSRFLASDTFSCPYYNFYDEYDIVKKQN